MDWKHISLVISVCFIQTVFCVYRPGTKENITECIGAGLNCSTVSECKSDTKGFFCFCFAGFTGETCQSDKDECDVGHPCRQRGVCHNAIGSFRCDCLPGWRGSHCEHSDGSHEASCVSGYTGVHCTEDFDECKQWHKNPCEHNSTCVNTQGNFSCSCATGWEGRICNEDINECNLTSGLCKNGGNCTNVPGGYKCVCPYPYTGAACSTISKTTTTTTTTTTTITPVLSTITRHTSVIFSNTHRSTTKPTTIPPKLSTADSTSVPGITKTTTTAPVSTTITRHTGVIFSKTPRSTTKPTTRPLKVSTADSSSIPGLAPSHPGQVLTTVQTLSTLTNVTSTKDMTVVNETSIIVMISSNQLTTSPNATNANVLQKAPKDRDGGSSNVGVIAGPVVGILVIAGAVGAGLVVYNKYYRKSPKVDPSEETEIGQTGDSNKNTKWKAATEDAVPKADPATLANGTTP